MTTAAPGAPNTAAAGPAGDGLVISDLSIGYRTSAGTIQVLRNVDLTVERGTAVGLVGESGSGKSTLAYAIVRYLSENAVVSGGEIRFHGRQLLQLSPGELRALRGTGVGMVYQDPATALNPTLRLGEQLIEGLMHHLGLDRPAAEARGEALLHTVSLPNPRAIMARFPHEVSGGEKQRVLIGMAFACGPQLLVFDEPTTALDATTAAGILDLIRELQANTGVTVLYITHDLGNVARVAAKVNVIYAGQIVECGPVDAVLREPRHPYTRALMASVPNPYRDSPARQRLRTFAGLAPDLIAPPPGCVFQDRCPFVAPECRRGKVALARQGDHRTACVLERTVGELALPGAQDVSAREPGLVDDGRVDQRPLLEAEQIEVYYGRTSLFDYLSRRPRRRVRAVAGVGLTVGAGETVGLVGESGCGKSTLARALVGLTDFHGQVRLDGRTFDHRLAFDRDYRQAVQIVFQHPDLSLNPRKRVGQIVGRPLRLYEGLGGAALRQKVAELLEQVRLPAEYASRRPFELSGGEKQRVAIARAFGPRPRLVICDEITSGLDVSVQASILNLLADLQDRYGTAYLFISHDLNLVQHLADRVTVMYLGRNVESRPVGAGMLLPPYHPYTEALLSAVPVPEPGLVARRIRLTGPLPDPAAPPAGCCFADRCPRQAGEVCRQTEPPLIEPTPGHRLACHLTPAELNSVGPIWRRE